MFVNYNGDGGYPEVPEGVPPVVFQNFAWHDDFADARNHSFDMVHNYMDLSGNHFDWILWVDTDDSLEGDLRATLDELDSETQGVFLRYDYAVDPETEQVLAVQWRERLFRTDVNAKWHYPIHEICHTPIGTQYARKHGAWVRHWRQPKHERSDTRGRNRRILSKARREHPEVPRFTYYFANEIYAEAALLVHEGKDASAEIQSAIKTYEDFIPHAPSPDDAYLAAHQIAELNRMRDDHLSAIESDLQAMMIHPTWPDAYIGISQSYMAMEDWPKCEFWARACLNNCAEQETTQVREPLNDDYIPRLLLGISLENQGNLTEALAHYEEIATYGLTSEVEDKILNVRAALLEPVEEDREDPLKAARKELFGTQPEKSICFFTRPLFENWHPESVGINGIGGAETCVIEVAKRFRADGWRVVVFGSPGEYAGVDSDGIEWWDSNDFLTTERFTILVSSRVPEIFDAQLNAETTVLWMHDVNVGDNFEGPFGNRLDSIDKVIGLTKWHCNHLRRLYDIPEHKLIQIGNGIDLDRFDVSPVPARQDKKFVWSSSPDRGIDVVINLWPSILERWPHAELHVYYGWNSIDKIIELQPMSVLKGFKQSIMDAVDEINSNKQSIYWHDRIDQKTLAKELLTCDGWLYPTYFLETFCITAIEMQAAGVIPFTNSIGALTETAPDLTAVRGWANNKTFMRSYIEMMEETYEKQGPRTDRQFLRKVAENYTWDNVYQGWLALVAQPTLALVA